MVRLLDYDPILEGIDQFPLEFIEQRKAIRLSLQPQVVGVVNLNDQLLKSELEFFLQEKIEFVGIDDQELAEFLSRRFSQISDDKIESEDEKVRLDRLANDAPIVNLVNNILLEGIRLGCSDIHLEALSDQVRVRYRIDGVLRLGRILSRELFPSLSSRLKVMANLNIIERRLPQDGRLTVNASGQDTEFRISIIPLAEGESIVLRMFHRHDMIQGLEELGFSGRFLSTLRTAAKSSNGLILLTGPTGSGKTTTLNALIRELSHEGNKVITIEDPVENVLPGVNQIQTNEDIGLSFESILRRILRQDPDILMVGEIRDRRTAELSIRSALTGHLVLSTLHTNDALSSIQRLINMGTEAFLLGTVLRGVVAQRLVRKVCPICRIKVDLTPSQQEWLKRRGYDNVPPLFAASGCDSCRHTGYSGRTVLGEIFSVDETFEELITKGAKHREMEQYFKRQAIPFLFDDAWEKVLSGVTTLSELERVVMTE